VKMTPPTRTARRSFFIDPPVPEGYPAIVT
jgi:hypothetical protein